MRASVFAARRRARSHAFVAPWRCSVTAARATLPSMSTQRRLTASHAEQLDTRPDVLVARAAARQQGVLHIDELRACGLTHQAIAVRVRNGRLHPLYRAVYAVGHAHVPHEGWWLA